MEAAGVNETLVEHWMGHKLPGTIDACFFSPENQEQIYMNAYPRIALCHRETASEVHSRRLGVCRLGERQDPDQEARLTEKRANLSIRT
jgi:hypothetical protein